MNIIKVTSKIKDYFVSRALWYKIITKIIQLDDIIRRRSCISKILNEKDW